MPTAQEMRVKIGEHNQTRLREGYLTTLFETLVKWVDMLVQSIPLFTSVFQIETKDGHAILSLHTQQGKQPALEQLSLRQVINAK